MNASRQSTFLHPRLAEQPLGLKRALILYAVVISLGVWAYEYWQITGDKKATLAASQDQLTTIAVALSTHIEAMINDGVGAAAAAAGEIEAQGGMQKLSEAQMSGILSRMLTGGDYVKQVFVASPRNFVGATRPGYAAAAGTPEWAAALFTESDDTQVAHPMNRELGDTHVVIPIARRVKQGEQLWAGAVFGIESLDRMYRTLPTEHTMVSLISTKGEVLMRTPPAAEYNVVGSRVEGAESFKRTIGTKLPFVFMQAPNPSNGEQRLYAVSRIAQYPIYAVASRGLEVVLTPWKERARSSIESAAISALALIALTIALYVVIQRRYEAVRRSEERFHLAARASNGGIWDWDIPTNHVYYSPRLKQLLGIASTEPFPATPDAFWNRMHPDDVEPIRAIVQQHLKDRTPYEVEYRIRVASGEYRWFSARAQAVWNDEGQAERMAGSIADIHERKLAEQSLRQVQERELHAREEFTQHLISAQEQERQRIANELHDSVGQNLSLIKNRAQLALQDDDLPPIAQEHVQAMAHLTANVIAEIRSVAYNLRPLHIEQLGLTDALENLLRQMDDASSISLTRRLENIDDAVTGANATHFYRIVQEALNNIMKHAKARQTHVLVERDLRCVRLEIKDDGVGFNTTDTYAGIGLASIRERTRMLHATVTIESHRGIGTTLTVELPIAEFAETTTLPPSESVSNEVTS